MFQGTLATNGSLTDEQKMALIDEQENGESAIKAEEEARRTQQVVALKSRMAAQRTKQLEELRERQEREKMEVGVYWSQMCYIFVVMIWFLYWKLLPFFVNFVLAGLISLQQFAGWSIKYESHPCTNKPCHSH